MRNTDTAHLPASGRGRDLRRARRGALATVGLLLLALVLLLASALVALLGPWLALGCESCQGGIRDVRFGELVVGLAYAAPLGALGTVVGMFLARRRGALVGLVGLGAQPVLLGLMLLVGRVPA